MKTNVGCIVGEGIFRRWQTGELAGQPLGFRDTPFGPSGQMFLVTNHARPFHMLLRYGAQSGKTASSKINNLANLYALKDHGVERVLGWGASGAVTHTMAAGDVVILSDLVDQTYLRRKTFFEDSPLGHLRQFPVFCPALRRAAGGALDALKLPHQDSGIAAIREGPRLETPAEVRMLSGLGADIVTHTLVPEMFLAKELQMCYAAVCYVVNFAETGSRHRPFVPGGLFGGLIQKSDGDRVEKTISSVGPIMSAIAEQLDVPDNPCECRDTMAHNIQTYGMDKDWRKWFA